jgi:hypothetical protein
MSLFLMFDVDDERDDILDAADNNNRDYAKKKSINNRDNTFKAVEDDGDDSDTNKTMPSDGFSFFQEFNPDLLFFFSITIIFCGVDVFVFIMVYSTSDYWK